MRGSRSLAKGGCLRQRPSISDKTGGASLAHPLVRVVRAQLSSMPLGLDASSHEPGLHKGRGGLRLFHVHPVAAPSHRGAPSPIGGAAKTLLKHPRRVSLLSIALQSVTRSPLHRGSPSRRGARPCDEGASSLSCQTTSEDDEEDCDVMMIDVMLMFLDAQPH